MEVLQKVYSAPNSSVLGHCYKVAFAPFNPNGLLQHVLYLEEFKEMTAKCDSLRGLKNNHTSRKRLFEVSRRPCTFLPELNILKRK
ncbi:hypothetical protein KM043_018498 [Ampulex compressa]|nr:hypothetical protein KM043_018498 [Ampulex compressa]